VRHVGPVYRDERLLDLAADHPLQLLEAGRRIEAVKALRWQVAYARDRLEAQQSGASKDMVCEAPVSAQWSRIVWPASVIGSPSRI
jgi:hypothetical protein